MEATKDTIWGSADSMFLKTIRYEGYILVSLMKKNFVMDTFHSLSKGEQQADREGNKEFVKLF